MTSFKNQESHHLVHTHRPVSLFAFLSRTYPVFRVVPVHRCNPSNSYQDFSVILPSHESSTRITSRSASSSQLCFDCQINIPIVLEMSSSAELATTMNHNIARAQSIHRERQLLALQTLYPGQGYSVENIAGSTTILSPSEFGRKLNHTYGFALDGKVTIEDLRKIEAAYERNGNIPEVDMCEFADKSGFDLFSNHYTITGSQCEYRLFLADFQPPPTSGDTIEIDIVGPEDHNAFVQASIDGFRSGGRPDELLKVCAESAASRSDTILFSASIAGEIVGTAAMAMIETPDNKIVVLYCDSCLPSARGKGVHKALLLERLRVARDRGFDLASATAREGSISGRNMEKVGFKMTYVCTTYTKEH